MRKKIIFIAFFAILAGGAIVFSGLKMPSLVPDKPEKPFVIDPFVPGKTSSIPEANNRFVLDFYHRFGHKEENNFFVSPYSIFSALAMTYEGARGETAEEMRTVLTSLKKMSL